MNAPPWSESPTTSVPPPAPSHLVMRMSHQLRKKKKENALKVSTLSGRHFKRQKLLSVWLWRGRRWQVSTWCQFQGALAALFTPLGFRCNWRSRQELLYFFLYKYDEAGLGVFSQSLFISRKCSHFFHFYIFCFCDCFFCLFVSWLSKL